jgi:hypothetical protein
LDWEVLCGSPGVDQRTNFCGRRAGRLSGVLPLVVIGFVAAVVIGGVVWAIFTVNNGAYRDGVVLDTWPKESCGWSGPPEHQTYSCSTTYWATVSY